MSIFWLGGDKRIVPREEIRNEHFEDRFFLPGIIHGSDDYIVNIYMNDARDGELEPDSFEVNYFTRDLIKKAYKHDPLCDDDFMMYLLSRCENFGCDNDGTGDFADLLEAWPESIKMSNEDLVDWAFGIYKK